MEYQPMAPPPPMPEGAPSPTTPEPMLAPASPTPSMMGIAPPAASHSGGSPIMLILVVLLGLGALGFGMMAITYYGQAQTAQQTLSSQKAAAVAAAIKAQKAADTQAYAKAAESPFRSFNAPDADGSFVINFPKDWSSWVDEETSGTDVNLILNPNFVGVTNGINNFSAATVRLIDTPGDQYMQQFQSYVQSGTMKQQNITISGLSGYDLTGTFNDNMGTVREDVVPVRDKVLVFTCENAEYMNEYNEILAQAKIFP